MLLTEHAMIDDNGDGEGSRGARPDLPVGADGRMAQTIFFAAGLRARRGPVQLETDDPALLYGCTTSVATRSRSGSTAHQMLKDAMEPASRITEELETAIRRAGD